jgi:hypothetical protein
VWPVATVRCPKCGAINPDGRRRLGRCGRCHEALGKCRYCRHYDPRMMDCTHLSRRTDERIVDADAVLDCPDFSSLLVTAGLPSFFHRPLVRTTLLGLVLAVPVLLGLLRLLTPPPPPPPAAIKVSARATPASFLEDGFDVTVFVHNQADHPATEVRVFVSGRSMSHLICQYVDPPETFEDASPRATSAFLGDLQPGQIKSVQFHFRSTRASELALVTHVTAANLDVLTRVPLSCEVLP